MPPMMMIGMSSAQNALTVARSRSFMGSGWPSGRSVLRSTHFQATIRPTPMMMPGTMPARNSDEIEVLVVTP